MDIIFGFFLILSINIIIGSITFLYALRIYMRIPGRSWVYILFLSTGALWLISVIALIPLALSGFFLFDLLSQLSLILCFSSYMGFSHAFESGLTNSSKKIPLIVFFVSTGFITFLFSIIEWSDKFANLIEYNGYYFSIWKIIPGSIFSIGIITAGLWMENSLKLTSKRSRNLVQRKQLRNMRIGNGVSFMISPFIVSTIGLVAYNYFNRIDIAIIFIYSITYFLISIGLLFILWAYTIRPTMAYLQPQVLDYLLVLYSGGLPVFTYEFIEDSSNNTNFSLISGAITAFSALAGEAFAVSENIEEIIFGGKSILFDEKGEYVFILVCQKTTSFLTSAFDNFIDIFSEKFENVSFRGNSSQFDSIKPNTEKIFGY